MDCSWMNPEEGLLEQKPNNTASVAQNCFYPRCEECAQYVSIQGAQYCTTPIVVTRHLYERVREKLAELTNKTHELESIVYGAEIGDKDI